MNKEVSDIIIHFIRDVGFPIFVAVYLLVELSNKLNVLISTNAQMIQLLTKWYDSYPK